MMIHRLSIIAVAALTAMSVNAARKGTIFINKDVTTHIVMTENIKIVDISTDRIVGNQCAPNIVRIKPLIEEDSLGRQLTHYGNCQLLGTLTIIGERNIAQYDIAYADRASAANSIYKVEQRDLDDYLNPEVSMPESDMASYCWAIYRSKRRFNNITSNRNGMKAAVNNIYSMGNYFFIDFSLDNRTRIHYDIAEIRVFLADKKEVKATNVQTLELTPVYTLNLAKGFDKDYRNVLVLDKLTFPEEKVLRIEISENQISGRVIALEIEYEDVLHADGFSPDLFKKLPDTVPGHIYR
mgnify:CR=1 FL=1